MDIQPDILTCAKALSAAYLPISAVMVNDRVFQGLADESHAIGTFGHGFTYSGHPVPAAVAIETLKIYDETDMLSHVREVGALSAERAAPPLRRPSAGGRGARRRADRARSNWWTTRQRTATSIPPPRSARGRAKLLESFGVIGRPLPGDGLAFSPPLIITAAEIDIVLDAVAKALEGITTELRAEGLAQTV